jgi:hypothetical protein
VTIEPIPMEYNGTKFRSTLEADWAATFDTLRWHWQYEPVAVKTVVGEAYLCDFHLPNQRVWCEVKGPHNERLDKVRDFYETVEPDPWDIEKPLVVILRPAGPGNVAMWEPVAREQHIVLATCPECLHHCFMDYNGVWACRRGCRNGGENKFWTLGDGALYWPGEIRFARTPRSGRGVRA